MVRSVTSSYFIGGGMLVFEWNFLGLSSETKPLNNEKVIDGSTFYECDTSSFFIYYNGNWYKQTFVTDDGINVYLYKFLMRKMFKNAFDTNISKTHVYNPEISSNISFTTVLPSNIAEMEMYGDTYQQTYSGKNLCALGTKTVDTYELFPLVKSLPAGTYTFSAQVTSTDTRSSVCFVRFMNGGNGVGAARISRSDERTYITVTTSGTADGLYLYAGYNASDSAGDTAVYTDIQIEAGSTATPYEQYVGGVPAPNPDYPQDVQTVTGTQLVKVCGKNLLKIPDGSLVSQGLTVTRLDNTITVSGKYTGSNNYKSLLNSNAAIVALERELPAGTYVVSMANSVSKQLEVVLYNSSDVRVGHLLIPAGTRTTAFSLSETATGIKLFINYLVRNEDVNVNYVNLQIEAGSTSTTYQPYQSQSYTVDLGTTELCKIGDYQDYIYKSGDDWYVHKETGNVVLDGSDDEGWIGSSYNRIRTSSAFGLLSNSSSYIYYANQLINANSETVENSFNIGAVAIYIKCTSKTSSVADWKTWLSSNNLIIYAPLVTPTDTKITDAELISSLNSIMSYTFPVGLNYVTVSASNLPALLKLTITEKE